MKLMQNIEIYEKALKGEYEIHVWQGNISPWMHTVVVKPSPHTGVSQDAPALPKQFKEDTEMKYAGVMVTEDIQRRLDSFKSNLLDN